MQSLSLVSLNRDLLCFIDNNLGGNMKTKSEIINEFKISEKDTGSVYVQIALLTERIEHLTEHLKQNPKDNHTRRGLLKLVGKRKKMLNYLEKSNIEEYRDLKKKLNIR